MKKKKWEAGKKNETEFWSNWIKTKGAEWTQDYINRLDVNLPFQDYLIQFLPDRYELAILDVGAGPLTPLGKVLKGHKLNIIAVDPLANEYNELLEKYNIAPKIKTEYCEAERLTGKFPQEYFDFIHVSNALDHCFNPLEGVTQMLFVLKKDCNIFLSHFTNEAEKENYTGFHQWNFCEENKEFIIWNKDTKINVNETLKGRAEIKILSDSTSNFVTMKKN